MPEKEAKPPQLKAWDRRPWPESGDATADKTHAAVGRALTAWETYEGVLAVLFSVIVAGMKSIPAYRAYSAVRTFEARLEMLRAASSAHFATNSNSEQESRIKTIVREAACYSPRRNEIAHGLVHWFSKNPEMRPRSDTFALYPPFVSFKERDLFQKPTYCYTSVQLDYYSKEFLRISELPATLASALGAQAQRELSLRKGHGQNPE